MTTDTREPRRSPDGTVVAVAAVVAPAFVLALFNDQRIAFAAAGEPRAWLAFGTFVSRFGLSGYMLLLSAVLAGVSILAVRLTGRPGLASRARRLAERAIFFFAAIAASGLTCQAIKHLTGRARPRFVETLGAYHFAGPSLRSGFESFPSGHSTTAFAAALALTLLKPSLGLAAYPAAALICLSRVLAEAHYPSDTLAGAVLGTLVTLRVARAFAHRDLAFTVSDPLPIPAIRRTIRISDERDLGAL